MLQIYKGVALAAFAITNLSVWTNGCVQSTPVEVNTAVKVLTDDNFDDFINMNNHVLVKFYAPWCGHCQNMAADYESAAKSFRDSGSEIKLAKVDSTENKKLNDRFAVRGYPTLKFFVGGEARDYTGGRTEAQIIEWLKKMSGPVVSEVESHEAGLSTATNSKVSVSYHGSFKDKSGDMYNAYTALAAQNRDIGEFYVAFGGSKDEVVVRHLDEEHDTKPSFIQKSADTVASDLKDFIRIESLPLFGNINANNFKNYSDREHELVWFCGSKTNFDNVKENMRKVAKQYRNEYSFVWLDTDVFRSHAEQALGINEVPSTLIQAKNGRYVLPNNTDKVSADEMTTFIKDVIAGKISKNLKSQAIPETNTEAVKIVVGKSFNEWMDQADKGIFLEVYAPWCRHCKTLEPIYNEFAAKMKDRQNLIVAKIDGSANESPNPDYVWEGFPTIFFKPPKQTTPIKYEGARTVEGLIEFTDKHMTSDTTKSSDTDKTATTEPEKDEL